MIENIQKEVDAKGYDYFKKDKPSRPDRTPNPQQVKEIVTLMADKTIPEIVKETGVLRRYVKTIYRLAKQRILEIAPKEDVNV